MKIFFTISLVFLSINLYATAPLTSGYPLAPRSNASAEEKNKAYLEARNRVIASALTYENTPYRYGGMTAAGLDCSGFIGVSFKDALGVALPRSARAIYAWVEKIPLERAQPGDLLFFKTDSTGNVTHAGIYLGNRRFIHAASAGARTGVIINSLDDGNWMRNYAGAGRALPEVFPGSFPETISSGTGNRNQQNTNRQNTNPTISNPNNSPSISTPPTVQNPANTPRIRFLAGFGIAPTWNALLSDNNAIRGLSSQFRFALDITDKMIFGLETRPEYDGVLGVFRLPLTLSWGPNDKLRVFAGPVLSVGNAIIKTNNEERTYSGGTSWFGTVGITAAPFIIKTDVGDFAMYAEAAWQSYFSDNNAYNLSADFSAGFRFSTGIRWTTQLKK